MLSQGSYPQEVPVGPELIDTLFTQPSPSSCCRNSPGLSSSSCSRSASIRPGINGLARASPRQSHLPGWAHRHPWYGSTRQRRSWLRSGQRGMPGRAPRAACWGLLGPVGHRLQGVEAAGAAGVPRAVVAAEPPQGPHCCLWLPTALTGSSTPSWHIATWSPGATSPASTSSTCSSDASVSSLSPPVKAMKTTSMVTSYLGARPPRRCSIMAESQDHRSHRT